MEPSRSSALKDRDFPTPHHFNRLVKRSGQRAFPGREIVQVNVDGIAAGGRIIPCTTQQEPKAG